MDLFLFQPGITSYRCSVCLAGSVCWCLYCGDIPSPSTPVFVSAWYHVLQVLSLLLSVFWRYTIPLNTCFCFSLVPRPTGAQSVVVCILEIYHPPQHLFLFQLGTTSYRCSVCCCLYFGDIPSPSTPVFVSAWYHVLQVLSLLLSVLWRYTIPLNTCFCFSLVPRPTGAQSVGVCIVEIYHPPQHLFLFQLGITCCRWSVCLGGSVCCLYCGDIPSPSTPVFVSAWYHVLQVISVFGWLSLLLSVLWRYTIPLNTCFCFSLVPRIAGAKCVWVAQSVVVCIVEMYHPLNTCFCFSLVPRVAGAQSVVVCIVEIYHPPQHLFLFQLGTTCCRWSVCLGGSVCCCLYCGDIPSPSTPVFVSAWYHVLQVLSVFGWLSLLLSVLWRCTIPSTPVFVSAWYHVLQVLSLLLSVLWRYTIPLNTCFCFSLVPRVAGAQCVWVAQSVGVCIVEIYHPPQHLFLFQLGTTSYRC